MASLTMYSSLNKTTKLKSPLALVVMLVRDGWSDSLPRWFACQKTRHRS